MYIGTLFIISAPSGAGKSSLIKAYLAQNNDRPAKVSISHTTRVPRVGEQHGEHYYFVNNQEFETLIAQDAFIEHAHVFDHYYGTSKAEIDNSLAKGINVFLDIDWQGAKQVKQKIPDTKMIFILPPSIAELENRLIKRDQDSKETILKRMQKAKNEMSHYQEYDYVIINDDFQTSLNVLNAIITASSVEKSKQQIRHQPLLKTLIEAE